MPESRGKITFSGILKLLVLCAGACAMLYPFVFMILSSFKNNAEIIRNPPTFIPEVFTWDNYRKVFEENRFGRFFFNSVWLTCLKTPALISGMCSPNSVFGARKLCSCSSWRP